MGKSGKEPSSWMVNHMFKKENSKKPAWIKLSRFIQRSPEHGLICSGHDEMYLIRLQLTEDAIQAFENARDLDFRNLLGADILCKEYSFKCKKKHCYDIKLIVSSFDSPAGGGCSNENVDDFPSVMTNPDILKMVCQKVLKQAYNQLMTCIPLTLDEVKIDESELSQLALINGWSKPSQVLTSSDDDSWGATPSQKVSFSQIISSPPRKRSRSQCAAPSSTQSHSSRSHTNHLLLNVNTAPQKFVQGESNICINENLEGIEISRGSQLQEDDPEIILLPGTEGDQIKEDSNIVLISSQSSEELMDDIPNKILAQNSDLQASDDMLISDERIDFTTTRVLTPKRIVEVSDTTAECCTPKRVYESCKTMTGHSSKNGVEHSPTTARYSTSKVREPSDTTAEYCTPKRVYESSKTMTGRSSPQNCVVHSDTIAGSSPCKNVIELSPTFDRCSPMKVIEHSDTTDGHSMPKRVYESSNTTAIFSPKSVIGHSKTMAGRSSAQIGVELSPATVRRSPRNVSKCSDAITGCSSPQIGVELSPVIVRRSPRNVSKCSDTITGRSSPQIGIELSPVIVRRSPRNAIKPSDTITVTEEKNHSERRDKTSMNSSEQLVSRTEENLSYVPDSEDDTQNSLQFGEQTDGDKVKKNTNCNFASNVESVVDDDDSDSDDSGCEHNPTEKCFICFIRTNSEVPEAIYYAARELNFQCHCTER